MATVTFDYCGLAAVSGLMSAINDHFLERRIFGSLTDHIYRMGIFRRVYSLDHP